MKLSKIMLKTLIIATFISSTLTNTFADDKNKILIDHIFTHEDRTWYPGKIESNDFYITNNKENNISIDRLYMELKSSKDLRTNQRLDIESKQFKELAKNSKVTLTYKNTVLFEEELDNLLSEKGIKLSQEIDIKSNEKALLNMTIDMDEKMNNDAQALENIFSIGVAYKIDDTTPPVVDPDTDIDGETDGNGSDKLPQTGGLINSASLLALGTIVIGAGVVLNKKSSEEKGGKNNE
ncbi:hypothetical protein [Romboutsia sp.]|uniref:hypothetical protein n=1 Tax=Romboutsia sp. TaxID=1965302 RepID=UPI003F3730C8